MSLVNSLIPGSNLEGIMIGKVLVRTDEKNKGRIGVYIPRVMNLISNFSEQTETQITSQADTENDDNNEIAGGASLVSVNFLWAKRASDHYKKEDKSLGRWIIPPIGSSVFVFFLDGRPDQLYYLPFGPDDEIEEFENTSQGNPDLEIIHESINNGIMAFDASEDVDKFYIQMSDQSGITIDVKNKTIEILTSEENAKILMADKDISILSKSGKVTVNGDTINVKSDSKVSLESNGVSITANNDITEEGATITIKANGKLTLKTPDSATWMPNIVPQCPFTMTPHGGPTAGIINLSGK